MDVVVWTRGLCDWRLLPLSVLYYNRFAIWTALYDACPIGSSPDGVDNIRPADEGHEYLGYAGNTHGYWYFRIRTRRAPQGFVEITSQWCTLCDWRCSVSGCWLGTE